MVLSSAQEIEVQVNLLRLMATGLSSDFNLPPLLPSDNSTVTEMQHSSARFVDSTLPKDISTSPKMGCFHLWMNVEVIVLGNHQFKGYCGAVKNIQETASILSGLSI